MPQLFANQLTQHSCFSSLHQKPNIYSSPAYKPTLTLKYKNICCQVIFRPYVAWKVAKYKYASIMFFQQKNKSKIILHEISKTKSITIYKSSAPHFPPPIGKSRPFRTAHASPAAPDGSGGRNGSARPPRESRNGLRPD